MKCSSCSIRSTRRERRRPRRARARDPPRRRAPRRAARAKLASVMRSPRRARARDSHPRPALLLCAVALSQGTRAPTGPASTSSRPRTPRTCAARSTRSASARPRLGSGSRPPPAGDAATTTRARRTSSRRPCRFGCRGVDDAPAARARPPRAPAAEWEAAFFARACRRPRTRRRARGALAARESGLIVERGADDQLSASRGRTASAAPGGSRVVAARARRRTAAAASSLAFRRAAAAAGGGGRSTLRRRPRAAAAGRARPRGRHVAEAQVLDASIVIAGPTVGARRALRRARARSTRPRRRTR